MGHVTETCKEEIQMKKIIVGAFFLLFIQSNSFSSIFDDLKENKKTSYLDFILLKIEQRLSQRHGLLGPQPLAFRIQYQSVGSVVNFLEEKEKIEISIIGVMDKLRYEKKKYKPKLSDCNILRNLLLYGKYGYNVIFQKRNKYLTKAGMEDIFIARFLNNLSLSDKERNYILENTITKVQIIDPVRGNDFFCKGNVADELR